MKKIFVGLLFLLFNFGAWAQQYAVEVGAFATAPQEGYFSKIPGVYETLDVNYIYRYYKDAANKEAAKELLAKAKEAGFDTSVLIYPDQSMNEKVNDVQ